MKTMNMTALSASNGIQQLADAVMMSSEHNAVTMQPIADAVIKQQLTDAMTMQQLAVCSDEVEIERRDDMQQLLATKYATVSND